AGAARERPRARALRGHAPPVRPGRVRPRGRRALARRPARAVEPAARRAGDRDRKGAQMNDLIAEPERVRRTYGREPDGGHVVELRRTYDAPPAAPWGACTDPERIPPWWMPVSGDLRLGGRFQLEGNAGGDITECEPPRRLALTWEFGGDASVVTLDLTPAGDATELVLRHAVGDNE